MVFARSVGAEVKQIPIYGDEYGYRLNPQRLRETVASLPGFRVPVYPSSGNFLVLECDEAGVRPEAVCAALNRHNVMARQGSYHTKTFGDQFIKVSVSVPREWVEEFCALLPNAVEEARGVNEELQLF